MDPLSVAASVAGLCTLAESIVHRTRAYVRCVRGSEKEIAKVIRATAQLYGILEQIRLLEDSFDGEGGDEKGAGLGSVGMVRGVHLVKGEELFECEKTLRKLDAVLKKSDPRAQTGFIGVARKKLEWPLNSKEVAELLQDIENHKSMLNLALNANEMAAILSCLDTSMYVSQIVSQEQLANEEFRESQRKSAFSRRRQKIIDFMTTLDPRVDQTMYFQMKQDMTGLWFTEGDEFKAWMSKQNSTLWLSGIPGAGKTILFSSVIDKLQRALDEKSVMAYFYCDYRNPIKQDATTIIRSLIGQFAERNDLCFDKLEEFYEIHSSDDKISLPTQTDLVTLLLDMSEDVENAVILIDALDECLTERVAVIKLLRDLNIRSEKIKTLFASRDEVDISANLQGYTAVSMAENTSDIARYVECELKVKDWAKDLSQTEKEVIKNSLIEPAGGMFRWVACQLDALAKCKTTASRRKVLRTLPRDLSETYYRILKHIDSTEIADNRLIVQRVLKWVTWAATGLSLKELQEAVAVNAGDEELDPDAITAESDILDLCSSLVRCNPNGIIELAHATVKEFLTTIPSRSEYYFYHVDEASDMTTLASTCLTYLCLDNLGGEKDWESASVTSGSSFSLKTSVASDDGSRISKQALRYHFLNHAAENWDYYAGKATEDWCQVLALEKTLFAPTKSPQFLNWARLRLGPTRYSRGRDGGLLAESTTLQWAALLGLPAICRWLIEQGSDVHRATVVLGSSLACAVLGESVFHQRTSDGSDYGSDDGSSDYDEGYNARESRTWRSETRYETIATMLRCGATMDCMPPEETKSLMELALAIGEPSHVKLLLAHGAVLDTDCLAYLESQCSEGHRKAEMQDILSVVTQSNYAAEDAQKATRLLLQFETSSVQAAKLLADTLGDLTAGEGAEAQDKNGALRKVSEYGQYELVAQLLDDPDIIIDHVDKHGFTALHEAAQSGHLQVVQLLVERKFDVNAPDKDGDTPAMRAASCNHLEVVQYLHQHGAVLADQVNADGETIASVAADSDCHRILRYIAETDPHLVSSTTTNSEGKTILMVAAAKGSVKSTQYILDKFPVGEVTAITKDGRSALHFAAASGSNKVVELILKNHPDVNVKCSKGCTALHYAVDDILNPSVVSVLLASGADVTIKNDTDDLPVHYAATQGGWDNFSILKKLIENAGDQCEWLNEESGSCRTILQIVTSHSNFTDYSLKMVELFCARPELALEPPGLGLVGGIPLLNLVEELSKRTVYSPLPGGPLSPPTDAWRLLEAIKLLVRRGASVNCTDLKGNTALHLLCFGNLNLTVCDAVEFLLQHSAPIQTLNKNGSNVMDALFSRLNKGPVSPDMQVHTQRILSLLIDHASDNHLKSYRLDGMQLLNLCIQIGNPTIIRNVLKRGAAVDIPDLTPSHDPGLSPVRAICIYKTSDGVADEILDKCSDLNCLDDTGITLLVLACRFGKIDVARSLISKGADRPTTVQGVRAIADAAYNGHTEVVQFLIELGVDMNSTFGDRRMTPLMHAVERGNLATIKLLLEKGADVNIKAAKQWTLGHYLASREDPTLLHEMLPYNLIWDESAQLVSQQGSLVGGVTPLHLAAEKGFTGMITFLMENKLAPDVNVPNDLRTTALHVAVRVGHCHTVRQLLQAGADVNARDSEGFTPVHIAASHSRLSKFPLIILQDLLETGKYDHFLLTNEGLTALHVAAKQGTRNLVTLLLETPINVNAKDNNWLTPLHYAIVRGDTEIIEALEAAGAKHVAPSSTASSIDGGNSPEKQVVEPPPVFGANSLLLAAIKQRDLSLCKRAHEEGADLSFSFSECKEGKCTPLLFAIDGHKNTGKGFFNRCPAIAEFLAEQDVDIDAQSCMSEMLPMHLAAARGQDIVLRKLLARGAETKTRTLEAFHLAIMHGNIDTIKILLEHEEFIEGGSKQRLLNSQVSSVDAVAFKEYPDFTERKLLQEPYCGSAMHIAAYMGYDDILEFLIEEGAEVDSLNEYNHIPLMHAIWTDEHKSIQVLLDAGASIHHRDDFGRTPAYFALGNKSTVALTALQEKGADFSEGEYPNTWTNETYLNQALFQESWAIVNFLLKLGHDPNRHCGPYAHTPLQVALQITDTVKLEPFVAEHAPEYDENIERYGTLLAAACSQSSPGLVRMLLEKARKNGRDMVEYVNAGCYVYATPLYSAAFRGNMELLMMLIEEGADVRTKEGGWLGTPLDAACAMERVDVVKVLWEKGACLSKSKLEGPYMVEGCKGSAKMEVIREVLKGRDPYEPGPEKGSGHGTVRVSRVLDAEIGGKLVSRQTF